MLDWVSVPEVAVTLSVYVWDDGDDVCLPDPPHALTPKPIARDAINRSRGSPPADADRRLRANGSNTSPSATGHVPRGNSCTAGSADALAGTVTVSITFVTPAPAATVDGEKVAVAPAGSPLTENVSALPAPGGVTARVYFACPPGEAVAEDDEPLDGAIEKLSTT